MDDLRPRCRICGTGSVVCNRLVGVPACCTDLTIGQYTPNCRTTANRRAGARNFCHVTGNGKRRFGWALATVVNGITGEHLAQFPDR